MGKVIFCVLFVLGIGHIAYAVLVYFGAVPVPSERFVAYVASLAFGVVLVWASRDWLSDG